MLMISPHNVCGFWLKTVFKKEWHQRQSIKREFSVSLCSDSFAKQDAAEYHPDIPADVLRQN